MIPGVDPQRSTWRALKKHITAKIAELQLYLEAPNECDYTAMLRGSIKELRTLIEAVEPPISTSGEENTETPGPLY